jgi:hypothetical protein
MKNEKETLNQNQLEQRKQPLMYSDLMSSITQRLESKNLLIKEQPTKAPQTKRDNTIRVTFLKRSKNQPQK